MYSTDLELELESGSGDVDVKLELCLSGLRNSQSTGKEHVEGWGYDNHNH